MKIDSDIEKIIFNNKIFTRNISSKDHGTRTYFTRKKYIGTINGKEKYRKIFLHRAVWEFFNGLIPEGFIIHHIDGNPDNNDILNLECIPEHLHIKTRYHHHATTHKKKTRAVLKGYLCYEEATPAGDP